jgi:hypothetical protein
MARVYRLKAGLEMPDSGLPGAPHGGVDCAGNREGADVCGRDEHRELADDPARACYSELARVIERWLPLIPPGDERDRFVRAHSSFHCAGHGRPPLRLAR